jgi:hypothetical protein
MPLCAAANLSPVYHQLGQSVSSVQPTLGHNDTVYERCQITVFKQLFLSMRRLLYTVAQKTVPMFCHFGKTDSA